MHKKQKVIAVGDSLAVVLDKKFVELAKIEPGQPLAVTYEPEKGLMSLEKQNKALVVKGKKSDDGK
jgi:hypothetical protein